MSSSLQPRAAPFAHPAAFAGAMRKPRPGYWVCQVVGWLAVAAINIGFSLTYVKTDLPQLVAIYLWGSVTGLVITHGWRGVMWRRGWLDGPARTPWLRLISCTIGLSLLELLLVTIAFYLLRPHGTSSGYAWVPSAILFWAFIFIAWTALYAMVASIRRARNAESEALRVQIAAKDAELRALQTQVNPHFFFNSLNSVRALIFENPDAAAGMIDQLASLMRYALQSGAAKTVPLEHELEAVHAYLAIEKIRFEERLRPFFDVEAGLSALPIPPMALQTLVENAVKYGVERNPAGCEIRLTIKLDGAFVTVDVANQGVLAANGLSTRVGLVNARKRLELACGPGAQLDLSARDGWVRAQLRVPVPPSFAAAPALQA